jgi:3-phosphoshikimate 1-carboxyvinyltransferase
MFTQNFIDLPPLLGASGNVSLPGSKSISNRVLLLAALSEGKTWVHDLLDSDDTQVMLNALAQMGCEMQKHERSVCITGLGGVLKNKSPMTLFLGNAGTAMRPLCAALSLLGANVTLTGVARMYERPIKDLVEALQQIGAKIDYLQDPGFPPLALKEAPISIQSDIQVRGDVSSQFLTALLLALPLVSQSSDIRIQVLGELISKPYIEITLNLLAQFGVQVKRDEWRTFTIPKGSKYTSPGLIHVESDASSASYFIAAGALSRSNGTLKIQGLGEHAIQGDIRFIDAARLMGAQITTGANFLEIHASSEPLKGIDLDCNHIPDAAMTLVMMALFARGETLLRNIGSWRVKETDRISAMVKECRKLGATVEEGPDWIRIQPLQEHHWKSASIHTYDDHRMAMCFSLAAFNPGGKTIRIEDPKCVAKTFPNYFETFFDLVQPQMDVVPVICIDGPTASGKGTLAFEIAKTLGFHYLDSGALYRLSAYVATQQGIELELNNEKHIVDLVSKLSLRFEGSLIFVDGQEISQAIRSEVVGMNASKVSAMPALRAALVDLQRSFRRLPGLVADGRDMASVIFPSSALKIYLTADALTRAKRRHKQLISMGIPANIDSLYADLKARDERDMSRAVAPLKPAADALLLDNSELSIEQSVEWVLNMWRSKNDV